MIRMSLGKETVLPRDGRGDTAVPEGPASGGGGGVDRVGGVMMSPHPTCLGPTGFTGSVILTEQPHPHGPKPRSTHPLKTKNGLQHPPNNPQVLPPGQQQRMGKRRYSLGGSFKHPGFGKRRRRANSDSQSDPVLPSNFLLGGNIFDPLNLNSLLDEEVSRALNAETPKSSPLPARARDPVEILVPRDITDPLNLKSGAGEGEEGGGVLVSPMKNRKRHRNRHHGGGGGGGAQPEPPTHAEGSKVEAGGDSGAGGEVLVLASVPLFPASVSVCVSGALDAVPEASREGSVVPQSPLPYELNTTINCRDEVVPPILPRRHTHPPLGSAFKPRLHGDGGHRQRKRRRTTSTRSDHSSVTPTPALATAPPNTFHTPLVPGSGLRGQRSGSAVGGQQQPQNSFRHKPQKKKNRFQHGNYSRYYGYHGYYGYRDGQVGQFEDPRLSLLRPDWFRGKTVLDIGCSTGHLTLAIARHFSPAHILGIDVDGWLVHTARQNIRHFLSERLTQDARAREEGRGETERERWGDRESKQKTETAEQSGRRTQSRTKMASGTAEKKMEEEECQKEECRSGTAEKKMEEEGQKEECRSGTAKKKMEEEGQKEECRSGTAEKKMEEEGQKEECRSGTAEKKMEEEGQKEECRSGTAEKKMEEECRSGTAEKKMEEECRSGTAEKKMEEECRSGTAEKKMEEECSALEDLKRTLSLLSPGSGPRGAGRPLPPFPLSFRVCRGPIAAPPLPPPSPLAHGTPGIFPNNVSFITGDYMEDREPRPHGDDVTAGYDVILCLGVTKWVQLHSGDGGVVRMFRRIYTHLRPGGMLLLEPQPWSSYCCSKNTTETTYRNYCDIRLRPDNFCCYLTSTVGFTCYRLLTDTGFQRPIYLFHKGPAPRK